MEKIYIIRYKILKGDTNAAPCILLVLHVFFIETRLFKNAQEEP